MMQRLWSKLTDHLDPFLFAIVTAIAALGLLVACVLVTPPAAAQLFSPGALSRPHRDLEGIDNCQKCHAAGKQLDPQLCLPGRGPIANWLPGAADQPVRRLAAALE